MADLLIVDDDKDICEIYKIYCENMNIFSRIIVVHDGAEAIKKLQKQHFALIILDMNMPKKSGLDVIHQELSSNSLNKKKDVLVLSGNLDPGVVSNLIRTGLINFLSKPIDEDAFKAKIKKMVSG